MIFMYQHLPPHRLRGIVQCDGLSENARRMRLLLEPWLHYPRHQILKHGMCSGGARLELGLHLGAHFIIGRILVLQNVLVLLEFYRARVVDVGDRLREFLAGHI